MMSTTLTNFPLANISGNGVLQLSIFVVLLVALVKPLGWFMARVFSAPMDASGSSPDIPLGFGTALGWLERLIYRLCGVRAKDNASTSSGRS